jgi:hypothetical protein
LIIRRHKYRSNPGTVSLEQAYIFLFTAAFMNGETDYLKKNLLFAIKIGICLTS